MKNEFWIIDTESPGESENSKSAIGPFYTKLEAESWLMDDALNTFINSDIPLIDRCDHGQPDKDWAMPFIIVQTVRKVRPTPTYQVSIKLNTIRK
jgi:hypothetical protein